jgi:ribosomal protein S6
MINIKNIKSQEELKFYRYYFNIFVIKSSCNEDQVSPMINELFNSMKDMCELVESKFCGKKRTSYPIEKQQNAIYATVVLKLEENDNLKNNLNEIKRRVKAFNENIVLRHFVYRYNYNNVLPDNLSLMKTYIDKNIEYKKSI